MPNGIRIANHSRQAFEYLPEKRRMSLPGRGRNKPSIANCILFDPYSSGTFDFKFHVLVASDFFALDKAGCIEHLDAMANRKYPFTLSVELANDLNNSLIVTKIFRCSPTDDEHGF